MRLKRPSALHQANRENLLATTPIERMERKSLRKDKSLQRIFRSPSLSLKNGAVVS